MVQTQIDPYANINIPSFQHVQNRSVPPQHTSQRVNYNPYPVQSQYNHQTSVGAVPTHQQAAFGHQPGFMQNGMQPNIQTPLPEPHNRHLAFINVTPVPLIIGHYNDVHPSITNLINAGRHEEARSFALNTLESYRVHVLDYVYKIKRRSAELTQHMPTSQFLFATAVFNVFDTAQERLDTYHDKVIQEFSQFNNNLFHNFPHRNFQNEHLFLVQLEHRLKVYEDKVRGVKNIFLQSLAYL